MVINSHIMKKSLITLLALSSVASAEAPPPLLPDFTGFTWLQKPSTDYAFWNQDIGGNGSVDADLMLNNLKHVAGLALHETGWRWNTGKLNYSGNDVDFIKAEDGSYTNAFNFTSKYAYKGVFVVASRKLSDFLTLPNEVLSSLTISFKASGQSDIGFSAWVWDGTQATALIEETKTLNVGDGAVNAFTVGDLSLNSDMTLLFLWNECYDGTDVNGKNMNAITDLSSSYTTTIIPEPTTATLSLLALAGFAVRRRRASL